MKPEYLGDGLYAVFENMQIKFLMTPVPWSQWQCANCLAIVNYAESHTCPIVPFDIHGRYPPHPVPNSVVDVDNAYELNRKLDRIIELLEVLADKAQGIVR